MDAQGDNQWEIQHVTVVGLGLIGGSLAMAIREVLPDAFIHAVDPNPEPLTYAIHEQIVDRVSRTLPEFYADNHLIVIACHLNPALEVLKGLKQSLPELQGEDNILITDMGSCKRAICDLGKTLFPKNFIGGHPLAGKEYSGIQQATPLLFAGKTYLLSPPETVDSRHQETLTHFVKAIRARPQRLDPAVHDRYMAYMSHLPQLYAIVLTNLLSDHQPEDLLTYHGGGIDDQLRLSASPYDMWKDIFAHNADHLRTALEELQTLFQQCPDLLTNMEALKTWFDRSNGMHRLFHEKKNPF